MHIHIQKNPELCQNRHFTSQAGHNQGVHDMGSIDKRVTFDREDYDDIFNCIEKCILGQGFDVETGSSIAFVAFNTLYNSDVIEEEHALLWWYKNLDEDKRKADINVMVAKWIEWLEQDDSEDEE